MLVLVFLKFTNQKSHVNGEFILGREGIMLGSTNIHKKIEKNIHNAFFVT